VVVSGLWSSISNLLSLEELEEVPGVPNSQKDDSNDGEHDGDVESGSGSISIVGEEENPEACSNNEWDAENEGYKHVPPVDVLNKEHVEDLNEQNKGESQSKSTNSNETALDWETSTAGKILGLLG